MASPAPLGGNRTPALFASVVIVLIALTGVAALSIHPQGSSPSTFTGPKTTTTTGAIGLLLGLSLNQTVIEPGQTVGITVYEQNTLKVVNNVSAADKWPVNGLSVGPCGSLDMPFGIVVYRGNVSVLSVPGVQPLQLYEPGTYNCPSISEMSAYVFQPMSTELVGIPPANMSSTIDAKGYWGTTFLKSSFSSFAPGIYTVIAGDEWGDVATLQFNVSSASLQTTSSSETCGPAATVTQTSDGTTTTQVVTLCHSISAYTPSNNSAPTCSVPYAGIDSPSGNSSGVQSFPIVSIPAGQVGAICVTYFDNNANRSQTINLNGTLEIGTIEAFPYAGCSNSPCTEYHFVNSTDFVISSNVTSLTLGGSGAREATVAYTIMPRTDSQGFYWLNIPYLAPTSCSVEFPFAYGYSFNNANSTGNYFPLPGGYGGSCIGYLPNYYSQYPFAYLVGVSSNVKVTTLNCGSYTCDVRQG